MNTDFKVIGLTRLGIIPESTAPEAEALITRPSELFNLVNGQLRSELAIPYMSPIVSVVAKLLSWQHLHCYLWFVIVFGDLYS